MEPSISKDVSDTESSGQNLAILDHRFIFSVIMFFWTAAILLFLWAVTHVGSITYEGVLHKRAETVCDRDLLFRAWNMKYGGIYAPIKEGVLEPNPWLKHPKRDIQAGDMALTLINPAWMTRQINEMQQDSAKENDRYVLSRLTSSKLINPVNAPNEWEERALKVLESKEQDAFFEQVTNSSGEKIIRFAKPLLIAKGCLNCHGDQNYQIGDVRGIIASEIRSDHILTAWNFFLKIAYASSGCVWFIGFFAAFLFQRKLKEYFIKNRLALRILQEKKDALQEHQNHLEHLVEIRTLDLLEATRTEHEANEAKSMFLAHMSHEIRTPLNSVIGISTLLESEELSKKQAEYVRMILLSGETLLSLINDILDFSKIEAGKLELNIHEFDLIEKLDSIISILSTRFLEKDVELCLDIGAKVPHNIIGDGGRFVQIILNFAGNAAKFTESGGVRIAVELAELQSHIATLRFRIIDTGIGISEQDIKKLFQSYAQADASITSKYGGTGLGLTIAHKLIQLMGGEIAVTSQVGIGTCFEFTIPFPVSLEQEALMQENPLPATMSLAHLPSIQGIRVLIADDNPVLLDSLRDQLQSWEMDIETAADPESVLPMLTIAANRQEPFRLLVLDEKFADVHGTEMFATLQKELIAQNISVIFLQSLGKDTDIENMDDIRVTNINKPYAASVLFDAVMGLLFHDQFDGYMEQKQQSKAVSKKLTTNSKACHFLVAEDNAINQIVITEMLHRGGHTCDIVGNGRLAVEAVRKKRYAAVFMDCQMPEMDGYEASGAIRKMERESDKGEHIPIFALTANATLEDREKCIDAGMDDYCSKPIRQEALFAIITRLQETYAVSAGG